MYHHVLSNQETERNINRKHPETRVPLTQVPTMPFIIEKVLSAPTFKDERQTHYSGVLFSPKCSQRCALSISAAGPLNLILHSPHPHTVMTAASRPVLWLVHTSVVHSTLRSWCDHLPHQISQFPRGIWTVSYVLQGLSSSVALLFQFHCFYHSLLQTCWYWLSASQRPHTSSRFSPFSSNSSPKASELSKWIKDFFP